MPTAVRDVPSEVLDPINTWKDRAAYEAKARDLAKRFRENDAKYELTDEVRRGGPKA
jgi:phosphoenolpyruvate carboxykinase (ATP)